MIPGARLGAAAAIRATDRRMRLAVAAFLGAVSVLYAVGEVLALARVSHRQKKLTPGENLTCFANRSIEAAWTQCVFAPSRPSQQSS